MRFKEKFDLIFWSIIKMLPLLVLLILSINNTISLLDVFTNYGFDLIYNNALTNCINSIFGVNGILPIFNANSALLYYFSYLVIIEIIHLLLDIILFVVRFAHAMIDKFGKGVC